MNPRELATEILTVPCPFCRAQPGKPCVDRSAADRPEPGPHPSRYLALAEREGAR